MIEAANNAYIAKEQLASPDIMRQFERSVMLRSLDEHWRDHLAALDHLRQGIHLRSYAQKNPKQEYKREAFELFEGLLNTVKNEVTKITMLVQVKTEADVEAVEQTAPVDNVHYQHADFDEALANPSDDDEATRLANGEAVVREGLKVGRNDPCPCGSGKKYKQCHGQLN